jgi:cystathionine gamma-synthase
VDSQEDCPSGGVDVAVSSLTKLFSGKGDVMGGSLILNRASPLHPVLSATIARLEDGKGS